MSYFVTGATGFIGRNLIELLLEREGKIYVLVREGSRGRLEELRSRWGADEDRIVPVIGDLSQEKPRLRRPGLRAQGRDRPLLPSRGDLRHDRRRRVPAGRQRRGHAPRPAARRGRRRQALPHGQLDRRRRPLQGHLHRGDVRGGPGRREPPLLPDQARVRGRRPRGGEGAVARLPARDRRRPLRDRRDRQDRRALLLLQAAAAHAQPRAPVVPGDRDRGQGDQRRPGRLRGQGDGPHRPPGRPRRPGVPPHRPQPADRGPAGQHLRPLGPRARGRDADRPEDARDRSPSRCAAGSRCCRR